MMRDSTVLGAYAFILALISIALTWTGSQMANTCCPTFGPGLMVIGVGVAAGAALAAGKYIHLRGREIDR